MRRTRDMEERILAVLKQHLRGTYSGQNVRPGHDFSHVERTMNLAVMISRGTGTSPFLAQLAALFHDLHRSLHVEENSIPQFIRDTLSIFPLAESEKNLIVEAVLEHSKMNSPRDSEMTKILKDADRLDAMGAVGITRICQHRYTLVPYNPADPMKVGSTKEGDLRTLVDDFERAAEWMGMLRMPRARKLARRRFAFLQAFLAEFERELREAGVIK